MSARHASSALAEATPAAPPCGQAHILPAMRHWAALSGHPANSPEPLLNEWAAASAAAEAAHQQATAARRPAPAAERTGHLTMAVDDHVLLAPQARQWICAMQELSGGQVLVTPQAFTRAQRRCVEAHWQAARSAMVRLPPEPPREGAAAPPARHRVVSALAQRHAAAWRAWLQAERRHSQSAWRTVHGQQDDGAAVSLTIDLLSSGTLGDGTERFHDDAALVTEALVAGAHVLVSGDTDALFQNALNTWVAQRKEEGHAQFGTAQARFMMSPDDALHHVCRATGGGRVGDAGLRWAVAACRPEPPGDDDALSDALCIFLGRAAEQMPIVAEAALDRLQDLQEGDRPWRPVVDGYPLAPRTRSAEARRSAAALAKP